MSPDDGVHDRQALAAGHQTNRTVIVHDGDMIECGAGLADLGFNPDVVACDERAFHVRRAAGDTDALVAKIADDTVCQ